MQFVFTNFFSLLMRKDKSIDSGTCAKLVNEFNCSVRKGASWKRNE